MIDLYQAVNDYRKRCDAEPIDRYPKVWAGHYGARMVGEVGLPGFPDITRSEARVGLGLLVPFAYSREAVTTSFLIYDDAIARELLVTRLAALVRGGVLTTFWIIPYSIGDHATDFGEARREEFHIPYLGNALDIIVSERLGKRRDRTFEESMGAALHLMETLLV